MPHHLLWGTSCACQWGPSMELVSCARGSCRTAPICPEKIFLISDFRFKNFGKFLNIGKFHMFLTDWRSRRARWVHVAMLALRRSTFK